MMVSGSPIVPNRLARTALYAVVAALLALTSTTTFAQESPPALLTNTPPPYDDGLLRLSEILGAMHYLRDLCNSGEGSLWRQEMQGLIDAEQADDLRRARFIDAFNRGYDSFKAVYRTCTPAATLAIDRYMGEGERIARDIVARYGRQE
jgi:uncharacterized protein (TIGR02301 family)